MMPYMSICVVMINLGKGGNLRDQIFPRTGFAPSGGGPDPLGGATCLGGGGGGAGPAKRHP